MKFITLFDFIKEICEILWKQKLFNQTMCYILFYIA